MLSAFIIARSSCRGALWNSLRTGSQTMRKDFRFPALESKPTLNHVVPLSSSQTVYSASHDHSHSRLWTIERFLAAGLVGLLPLSIAFPSPVLDYALALSLTAHVHWGIEAVVVDYARPKVIGPALARAAVAGVYALTVFTLGGLFYFNYNDVGLCQAIRMLWKL